MAEGSSYYLDLVAGRRRGPIAAMLLAMLGLAAAGYYLIIVARNFYYSVFKFATRRARCPVISVGNITVGGTGKTPMVVKLANLLQSRGRRVAVLSRGYKGSRIVFDEDNPAKAAAEWSAASDEAGVLKRRCPAVQIYLSPDRVASAAKACAGGADLLILDDGFQHRRLRRDLDIVLVDATAPFGHDRMLPSGLLREPLSSLRRADLIVLTRSDEIGAAPKADLLSTIHKTSHEKPIVQAIHRIKGFLDVKGHRLGSIEPASMQAVVFAGVGNFESLRGSIQRLGIHILAAYQYPDHHYYTSDEIDGLIDTAATLEANVLLTTEKDAVKLVGRWNHESATLLVLDLEIEFAGDGDRILAEALDRALAMA